MFLVFSLGATFAQQNDSGAVAEADQLDAQIGTLYKQQKFDQALQLAQKELALREKAVGPDHPSVAGVYRNIGELYFAKGKYKEAITAYHHFLEVYEKSAGPDKVSVTGILIYDFSREVINRPDTLKSIH